jgi:hypothetical protein
MKGAELKTHGQKGLTVFEIEDVVVEARVGAKSNEYREFIKTLASLDVGQSFCVPKKELVPRFLFAVRVIALEHNRKFSTKAKDGVTRVGRVL